VKFVPFIFIDLQFWKIFSQDSRLDNRIRKGVFFFEKLAPEACFEPSAVAYQFFSGMNDPYLFETLFSHFVPENT